LFKENDSGLEPIHSNEPAPRSLWTRGSVQTATVRIVLRAWSGPTAQH
jgi:hypothetical protein